VSTRLGILQLLADGNLHSGADIGRKLGVTRAAVHKGVKALAENGLGVHAVAGLGYRLDAPITPLDRQQIARTLAAGASAASRVEVLETVDSTNRYLLARALADPDPRGMVCLGEVQPQGRGRQGKSWIATAYENLMMSMAWRFGAGPAMVVGLSLAAGVAVARALEAFGVPDAGLKWPNDILWGDRMTSSPSPIAAVNADVSSLTPYPLPEGEEVAPAHPALATFAHPCAAESVRLRGTSMERKLAGLLVDVHGEASGPCTVVVGIGVNCRISEADGRRIDQPWVDLHTITGATPDRNKLAALLIDRLQEMFETYAVSGLAAYQADWNRRHLFANRPVRLVRHQSSVEGTVDGIDDHGALRLRLADGRVQLFHSGEVSLRAAAECVS